MKVTERPSPIAEPRTVHLVAFALLAALLATVLTGYQYAESGFEEIDPMIRRAIDPTFLANDFFTNTTDEFGPRFYFSHVIASFATPATLPIIYFALTLLINVSIAIISALLVSDLFRSRKAGLIAASLVMGAASFGLGGAGHTHAGEPNSYWLSFPFALGAVWAASRLRPMLAGFLAGLVPVMHPSFGAAFGGLVFSALAIALALRSRHFGIRFPLIPMAGGFAVFAALLLIVVIPYSQETRIPDDQFFDILTTRAPHHLLPSTFSLADWFKGLMFSVTAIVSIRWIRHAHLSDSFPITFISALMALLILFLFGGWLFVEVVPWKPWFLAVPYRSTSFLLWLGLLLMAGSAYGLMKQNPRRGIFLYANSFSPVASGVAYLSTFIGRGLDRPAMVASGAIGIGLGLVLTEARYLVQFAIISGLALWFLFGPRVTWARAVGILAPLALALFLVAYQSIVHTDTALDKVGPEVLPSHVEGPEADIARAAKQITPPSALLLTPPTFGSFRVLAERAIVVDMRTIPYQELAMAEWMDRLLTVYGSSAVEAFGKEERSEILEQLYSRIGDSEIRSLCDRYHITHAVLFTQTPTEFDVVERNETYKIVDLDNC
jgi:hypothetical protein